MNKKHYACIILALLVCALLLASCENKPAEKPATTQEAPALLTPTPTPTETPIPTPFGGGSGSLFFGQSGLFIWNVADGSTVQLASDEDLHTGRFIVSSDNSIIATIDESDYVDFSFDVMNVDGTNNHEFCQQHCSEPGYQDIEIHSLAFSPDGQSMAFSSATGINIASVSDGTLRRISGLHGTPYWSPAGDLLALIENSPSDGIDEGILYLIDPAGDNPEPVQIASDLNPSFVQWSTDGTRLLLSAGDIYVQSVTDPTSSPTFLFAPEYGGAECTVWSQNGESLAFVDHRQLAVYRPDSGNIYTILQDPQGSTGCSYGCPQWSPDGTLLASYRSCADRSAGTSTSYTQGLFIYDEELNVITYLDLFQIGYMYQNLNFQYLWQP